MSFIEFFLCTVLYSDTNCSSHVDLNCPDFYFLQLWLWFLHESFEKLSTHFKKGTETVSPCKSFLCWAAACKYGSPASGTFEDSKKKGVSRSFPCHLCRTRPTMSGKQKRQLQEKLEYVQEVVKTKKVLWLWIVLKCYEQSIGCSSVHLFNSLFLPSRKSSMKNTSAKVSATRTWTCKQRHDIHKGLSIPTAT